MTQTHKYYIQFSIGSNHVFIHNVPEKYFQSVESTGQTGQSIIMPWSSLTHEFDQSSPEWEVRRLFNFSVLCIILLGLQELQILSVLLFHYCNKKSGQYISLHWDFGWQMQRSEREQSCCWLSPGKLNSNETHINTFGNIELNCSVLRWEEQQCNITFSRLIVTFLKNWYPPAASSFP